MRRSGLVSGTLPSQAPNLWKGPAIVAQALKPVQAQDKQACKADEKQAGQALQDNLLADQPPDVQDQENCPRNNGDNTEEITGGVQQA